MATPVIDAEIIEEFKAITGATDSLAEQLLLICNGDLQMAINMHVDGAGLDVTEPDLAAHSFPPRPPILPSSGAGPSSTPAAAAEFGEDYVRPPLPPKQEVLVESGYGYHPYSAVTTRRAASVVLDPFRDFSRETALQEEEFERTGVVEMAGSSGSERKANGLEDLFRPPIDLMFKGSLEEARDAGKRDNRWIMVNVQDSTNFACQTLNRDLWSNPLVKDLVKDNFIFWHVNVASDAGQQYKRFYPIEEWPHVAIIDPRTGERLVSWSKLDTCTFGERITDFLAYNPTPNPPPGSQEDGGAVAVVAPASASVAPPSKRPKSNGGSNGGSVDAISIDDEYDEDAQLKAAIEASLRESKQDDSDSNQAGSSTSQASNSKNDHSRYLGNPSDPKSELMLRLPDGQRHTAAFPCSSKLRALSLYVEELGFSERTHELVTNYPRRCLSDMDSDNTLKDLGLFPKETVFVQLRSA